MAAVAWVGRRWIRPRGGPRRQAARPRLGATAAARRAGRPDQARRAAQQATAAGQVTGGLAGHAGSRPQPVGQRAAPAGPSGRSSVAPFGGDSGAVGQQPRSRVAALAVWLFTVPSEQCSRPAVSSTLRSIQCRSTTAARIRRGSSASAARIWSPSMPSGSRRAGRPRAGSGGSGDVAARGATGAAAPRRVRVDQDPPGIGVRGVRAPHLRPGHVHPGQRGLDQILGAGGESPAASRHAVRSSSVRRARTNAEHSSSRGERGMGTSSPFIRVRAIAGLPQ